MKLLKRLFTLLTVLLICGGAFLGICYWRLHRIPTWYRPNALGGAQLEVAAKQAEHKFTNVYNVASRAGAQETAIEYARRHGTSLPATRPVEPVTIHLTENELNAFMLKWGERWRQDVEKYVTDPQFALDDGQIVFGGTIKELGAFGSLHLEPVLDPDGGFQLKLVSIRGGSLPIPESLLAKHIQKLDWVFGQWLPAWQESATVDSKGANDAAVKAAMSKLLLQTLHHQPSVPVFFVQVQGGQRIPMRLTHIQVQNGLLTITLLPLDADGRKAALEQIREPYTSTTAANAN